MYATLTECPLFRGLTADTIREMLSPDENNFTLTDHADGEVIARRETAYSGLMILVKGQVRGEVTDSSGRTLVVDRLQAPQLIAPAFLFGGYNRLPIDVVAEGWVMILTLHRGYLFELMQNNVVLFSNFIDIISNRASFWSRKIYLLSLRFLEQKVAAYLLSKSDDHSLQVPVPDVVDTAVYFDATRSSVQRALYELEKKRLIRRTGDSLEVLNRPGLQALIEKA